MGSAHPSAAPRNLGQDGRIHTDDKAPLPVVEFWGVTAVLMAPLIPPQTSLTDKVFPSNNGTGKQSQKCPSPEQEGFP